MKKIAQHRGGGILGVAYRSNTPLDLLSDEYDVMIIASSWDARCTTIPSVSSLHAGLGLAIHFSARDTQGLRDRHDRLIDAYVSTHSQDHKLIHADSLNIESLWQQVLAELVARRRLLGRPVSLLLDISACPRYLTLALLVASVVNGLASRLSLLYTEGRYPEPHTSPRGPEEVVFTTGSWRAVPVPGLEGEYDPSKRRFYLVSVGFEGWKTLRIVSRADPDRVSILFPNPGVHPEYASRARKDNDELLTRYRIPPKQIVDAPAADAITAWKRLSNRTLERGDEENAYFLCCGSKPHSVALGLRAITLGFPAVLYHIPERHLVVPISPGGIHWLYDISSVTLPI